MCRIHDRVDQNLSMSSQIEGWANGAHFHVDDGRHACERWQRGGLHAWPKEQAVVTQQIVSCHNGYFGCCPNRRSGLVPKPGHLHTGRAHLRRDGNQRRAKRRKQCNPDMWQGHGATLDAGGEAWMSA